MGYLEKNLNPKGKKVGDCVIRAVAAATGQSWEVVHKDLCNLAFEMYDMPDSTNVVEKYLLGKGFSKGKVKVVKGGKRPTVKKFAEENRDIIAVLRVANHLVACAYGNYVDIWDSGRCSVYKYWYKSI